MMKKNIDDFVMNNIKEFMDSRHSDKQYSIKEYSNFYTATIKTKGNNIAEPIIFSKKSGLPLPKSFASIPVKDCKNPKLVYESGGERDGKK